MKLRILESTNNFLGRRFISDFESTDNLEVRIAHGFLSGWSSIIITVLLFVIKISMGLASGSISIVADAFHMLSHLANSIILVVTFWVTARPATEKTPFGHGRMEHVGPLIMSIFLFVSGIQIAERSIHQTLHPQVVHYWNALPWILLVTVFAKLWMEQFILFLGNRVHSKAIISNARHQRIEMISTLTVIAGLLAGHHFNFSRADGCIGIALSIWLLYLGYTHGHSAIIPLLGKAPDMDMIRQIRETAKKVEGISDVHEIIVHDYGSMYMISLHGEIPEKYGPARIHEVTEICESVLRKRFGGEVVCHSDPLPEKTPEIEAIENLFKDLVSREPQITGYHDFRVVAASEKERIIVADLDVREDIPNSEFKEIIGTLEAEALKFIPDLAYCSFYVTPKFAY